VTGMQKYLKECGRSQLWERREPTDQRSSNVSVLPALRYPPEPTFILNMEALYHYTKSKRKNQNPARRKKLETPSFILEQKKHYELRLIFNG
jgi:hypothetical protein